MDVITFVAVLFLVPSSIALLALRYGANSRPSFRSSEHILALHGMTWDNQPTASHEPKMRLVSIGGSGAYSTLAMIDRMREPEAAPFATDLHAARLEDRALQLVDEYWSDTAWLTGLVPAAAFQAVCSILERERQNEGHPEVLLADMEITEPGATVPATLRQPEIVGAEIALLSAGVG
jgi:hypothetical protein